MLLTYMKSGNDVNVIDHLIERFIMHQFRDCTMFHVETTNVRHTMQLMDVAVTRYQLNI